MSVFDTGLTLDDFAVLTDSLGQWESSEDGFLDFLERLRQIGDPPEDFVESAPEGFGEWWGGFKKEMFSREQKAKDKRHDRMEKATMLKTKLIIQKREMVEKTADMLFSEPDVNAPPAPVEMPPQAKQKPKEEAKGDSPPKPKQTHGKDKDPSKEG